MKRCLKEDVKFITSYNTKKMALFCSAKGKIKATQKGNITDDIQCPACKQHYIGKTDRCFATCLDEYGSRHDQPMFQHLVNCQQFLEKLSILNLPISDNNIPKVELNSHIMSAVHNNSKVLDHNNNYVFWRLFILKLQNLKLMLVLMPLRKYSFSNNSCFERICHINFDCKLLFDLLHFF